MHNAAFQAPDTRNPKPQTPNPKPETPNPKPETRKPETRFQALGLDWTYGRCETEDVKVAMATINAPSFGGGSVPKPYTLNPKAQNPKP